MAFSWAHCSLSQVMSFWSLQALQSTMPVQFVDNPIILLCAGRPSRQACAHHYVWQLFRICYLPWLECTTANMHKYGCNPHWRSSSPLIVAMVYYLVWLPTYGLYKNCITVLLHLLFQAGRAIKRMSAWCKLRLYSHVETSTSLVYKPYWVWACYTQ